MARLTARQRGYGSPWDRARRSFLNAHPWCRMCAEEGRQVRAEHVHHGIAHKGDKARFWDKSKWVPLCAHHHNKDAQQIETRGYRSAVDASGMPIDPAHPFNRD